MHDNRRILENRITREMLQRLAPAEVVARAPLQVEAHSLSGEPVNVDEVADLRFQPIEAGTRWGRPWGTTWFHVTGESSAADRLAPDLSGDRRCVEVVAELGFSGSMAGFQAEGAVYVDGRIRCGVHPQRRAIPLSVVAREGRLDFLLEAASNPDFTRSFTANPLGSLDTCGDDPLYSFGGVQLVVIDREVRSLVSELAMANELMRTLPFAHRRRLRLAAIIERTLDAVDPAAIASSAPGARSILAEAFELPAAPGSHHVSAIGHAHIDTAWLWPLRETRRKCARTFANQIQLMQDYPEHRFACSQAVQYAWVESDHPELFDAIGRRVQERRWIPVGGMWVEADMNLPSGESLVRQLVHGQRYFESRFGARCEEVWIPDVFGYPGNLPQIFASGGARRFVTQKLSWNKTNRFPHHSFIWEGIDGTEVLAHFPPVDTYNAEVTPREMAHAVSNFSDHRWSDRSLMPFGYGDGGGGPTREMLERARLLGDLVELPRLEIEAPAAFFDGLELEVLERGAPRWRGELYFEMHRGTFTTQARTKVGNRRCENALREAELWSATAGDTSRSQELDALWKRVLTQQFHDIIPGSSISWVHADAEAEHAAVLDSCDEIVEDALRQLCTASPTVANASGHHRREVALAPLRPSGDGPVQQLADGSFAFVAEVAALGLADAVAHRETEEVSVEVNRLTNSHLEVGLDPQGAVTSIVHRRSGRELVPDGSSCARLLLAPDTPVEYDAWDLEEWTAARAEPLSGPVRVEVVDDGPLVGSIRVHREFGASWVAQTFTLRAGSPRLDVAVEVDWHESERLLSIDFPLAVRTERAACEVQFGHEFRPTHVNTTWDAAKFEVCAHRWVDVSEPSFGVAVLNDGRYGHALQHGGVRVSLLRSPQYPDPGADLGRHETTLALLPHGPGLAEVLEEAAALNVPLRVVGGGAAAAPGEAVLSLDGRGIEVSAVKHADDGSKDLVVRLWEALGDRSEVRIDVPGGIRDAFVCNSLEEPIVVDPAEQVHLSAGSATLTVGPFRLVTLRLVRG